MPRSACSSAKPSHDSQAAYTSAAPRVSVIPSLKLSAPQCCFSSFGPEPQVRLHLGAVIISPAQARSILTPQSQANATTCLESW